MPQYFVSFRNKKPHLWWVASWFKILEAKSEWTAMVTWIKQLLPRRAEVLTPQIFIWMDTNRLWPGLSPQLNQVRLPMYRLQSKETSPTELRHVLARHFHSSGKTEREQCRHRLNATCSIQCQMTFSRETTSMSGACDMALCATIFQRKTCWSGGNADVEGSTSKVSNHTIPDELERLIMMLRRVIEKR